MENNTACIRWERTNKKDIVLLRDLKRFSLKDALLRKQKNPQIFIILVQEKNALTEQF
jgi:hypothetical protein